MGMTTRAPEWAADAGITYRQLDHWTRAEYLHPIGGKGSGSARDWPPTERARAVLMARLIGAGFTVAAAARIARSRRPIGRHVIAAGIDLHLRK